jgi:hypothetical protein
VQRDDGRGPTVKGNNDGEWSSNDVVFCLEMAKWRRG